MFQEDCTLVGRAGRASSSEYLSPFEGEVNGHVLMGVWYVSYERTT